MRKLRSYELGTGRKREQGLGHGGGESDGVGGEGGGDGAAMRGEDLGGKGKYPAQIAPFLTRTQGLARLQLCADTNPPLASVSSGSSPSSGRSRS